MFEHDSQNSAIDQTRVYPGDRSVFFSKVMGAFGLALLVSLGGMFVGFKYLLEVFFAAPAVMWVLFAAELILIFTARKWSTIKPMNYWLFALFAFLSGLSITPLVDGVLVTVGAGILMKALTVTVLMFAGTALFGWTTKRDLSGLGGFLMITLIGMIVMSIVGIFFPWGTGFEMMFSGAGILLFSAFTMYDVQMLKHYPEDRYIDAALNLYLDIFNLFIYVLRFLLAFTRE